MLHQNGYDIFWTLVGEKDIVGGLDYPREWKGRLEINAALRVANNRIEGRVNTKFESPSKKPD